MPPLYPVQTPVNHDGKLHTDGHLELTEDQARPLLVAGAVGPAKAAQPAATKGQDEAPQADPAVTTALGHKKVADVVAALDELTDEQRAQALAIEQASEKPRAGVIKALAGA